MRTTLTAIVIGMGILIAAPAQADRNAPLENLVDVPVGTVSGNAVPLESLARAILSGCARRGWVCDVVAPGEIKGTLVIRSHRADVRIVFDPKKYSIIYLSSENLRYNPGKNTIHRNYNKWVANLRNDINSSIALLP